MPLNPNYITLGLGPSSDIGHLVLLGLSPVIPAVVTPAIASGDPRYLRPYADGFKAYNPQPADYSTGFKTYNPQPYKSYGGDV